jgi:SAM-dependent methyltransferase
MTASQKSDPYNKAFHEAMSTDSYVRERQHPRLRDINYLHLKDLLDFMGSVAIDIQGDVFDYGCGCAPYRSLFSHCKRYLTADVAGGPAVDRVLDDKGMTQEPDGSCDVVLSTQVLEHIEEPELYLRESHRLLRPGGELILTTHGMFEEHGCPYDFQRWTCRGLEELVAKCGFEVVKSGKLTTEFRAFVQLLNQMQLHLRRPEQFLLHFPMAVFRKIYGKLLMPALHWLAGLFADQAQVPASNPASLYVCVFVRAKKLADKPGRQI